MSINSINPRERRANLHSRYDWIINGRHDIILSSNVSEHLGYIKNLIWDLTQLIHGSKKDVNSELDWKIEKLETILQEQEEFLTEVDKYSVQELKDKIDNGESSEFIVNILERKVENDSEYLKNAMVEALLKTDKHFSIKSLKEKLNNSYIEDTQDTNNHIISELFITIERLKKLGISKEEINVSREYIDKYYNAYVETLIDNTYIYYGSSKLLNNVLNYNP